MYRKHTLLFVFLTVIRGVGAQEATSGSLCLRIGKESRGV